MDAWYKCCVLQTEVASLQSPDCNTEWMLGINIATGNIRCRNLIVKNICSFAFNTYWVHKNVNQCVSLYLTLAINTEL